MAKVKCLLAYMPVLHQGYIQFIERHPDAHILAIFGKSIISEFDWLRKDIRAIDPSLMSHAVQALKVIPSTLVLETDYIHYFRRNSNLELVFADETESREVARKYFPENDVSFDSIFLRWDKSRVLDKENAQGFPVTSEELHRRFMGVALDVSERSSDWWIHVGAVLLSGDRLTLGFNRHFPSEYSPYVLGDPRSIFKKGIHVELTTALHAEAAVIGAAIREGVSTKDAKLYVSHFPCPFCTNFLIETGISEIYFHTGYSMMEGADRLRNAGIKLFQVVDKKPTE